MNLTKNINNNRSEKEYRALPLFSASDLRSFENDRKSFYFTKIIGEKKESEYSRAILIGSLVHCLLLEKEKFDEKYIISNIEKMPTGKMLDFTEALIKHTFDNINDEGQVCTEFECLVKEAYVDSGFSWTLETVLKKFNGSSAEDYYKQNREAKGRGIEIVTIEDINIAQKVVDRIMNDPIVGRIFIEEGYNEIQLEEFNIFGLQMKCMQDKIVIDRERKTVQIYDLKVVWDVNNFVYEYFLKKGAYIQSYIYWRALFDEKVQAILEIDENYEILFPKFIVADSQGFYDSLIFELNIDDMIAAENGFRLNSRKYKGVKQIVEELMWCIENNKWNGHKEGQITKFNLIYEENN